MGRLIAMVLAVWCAVGPAFAQAAGAIEKTIGDQLQAFNDRDVAAAW